MLPGVTMCQCQLKSTAVAPVRVLDDKNVTYAGETERPNVAIPIQRAPAIDFGDFILGNPNIVRSTFATRLARAVPWAKNIEQISDHFTDW